ncbi:MAG TPA: methionyl-tRNA formyltransferase [Beijerinckiaceae bacterium]|nr:methionyl-tRNA formyltransferase [Beijerinckiaceae bacterium]
MRVVFMGTPDFAVPALTELILRGQDVVAVYTRVPKPAGRRGLTMFPSPIQATAARFGLPVFTPSTLRSPEAAEEFRMHRADVAVVAAYGLLLPPAILEAPTHGCLNLHASLLPRWRGAAPIHRCVMAGDTHTGVTLMRMDEGLDTGAAGPAAHIDVGLNDTTGDVHDRLAARGAALLGRSLAALERNELVFTPQSDDGVTYARKIEKSECRIGWGQAASAVHNQIRGLSPFPGAFFETDLGRGPERIKVLESRLAEGAGPPGVALDDRLTIACGSGAVRLISLQRAGKARLAADVFLRGASLAAGASLV